MARAWPSASSGSTLTALVVALAGASTASAIDGRDAKQWAGRLAALGQRPAGGQHERQAAAIVRERLRTLGYNVDPALPAPGGRPLAERGRSDAGADQGDHRRAHGRCPRHDRRERQRVGGRRDARAGKGPQERAGRAGGGGRRGEERRYTGAGYHPARARSAGRSRLPSGRASGLRSRPTWSASGERSTSAGSRRGRTARPGSSSTRPTGSACARAPP